MTNNITPIGSRKSAKNEKPEQPVTKPAPKPTKKSARSEKPHVEPTAEPTAEPTWANDIREIDQAAIKPNLSLDELQRLSMNFTDIVDELADSAELPEPPEGYERCAECGLPTPVGGNGLCRIHDIKTVVVGEPVTSEAPTEQPSETHAEREAKVFTKTALVKLAREAVWMRLRKKHGMPLVKPGQHDADGLKLTSTMDGPGAALVTWQAPSIEDPTERAKFVHLQVEKCAEILLADGLPVERFTQDGLPYLRIPVTRTPGKADEKPAKRESKGGKQARWSLPLVTDGEIQGSGI